MEPVAIILTTVGWLISSLINKAITSLLEEWAKGVGLSNEFKALRMELIKINATLETARGLEKVNAALLDMLKHLRQLAYDADDLLDELDYYRIQDGVQLKEARNSGNSKTTGSIGSSSKSSGFKRASRVFRATLNQVSCSSAGDVVEQIRSSFPGRFTMSHRITKLNTNLRDNGDNVHKALLLEATVINRGIFKNFEAMELKPRETTSRMIERVFGRDKEKDNLINLITGEEAARQNLSVIAILGHGGVGKTTLARLVYNEIKVKTHFDLRMWVTVSVNFDKRRLTQEILESASGSCYTRFGNLDTLQTTLEKSLEKKSFLLVLDDLWENEKTNDWKLLLAPLKNTSKNGNVVLVTTRKPGIKNLDTTIKIFNLDGLEDNVYWSLFKAYAFGDENHEGHQNLQNVGHDIAMKLKGNPLAAKTVGRLLNRDLNDRHWRTVLESEEWKHDDSVNSIMSALQISYEHLPFHLQRCFSYCALFPKDSELPQEYLVHLWIAQNFIHSQRKRLEDVGKEYLDYLVDFGFFEKELDEEDEVPVYVMHDLLHDLAQNVNSEECLSNLDGHKINEISSTIRHISISSSCITNTTEENTTISASLAEKLMNIKNYLKAGKLSTFMFFNNDNERIEGFPRTLKDANGLRVLVLDEIPNARALFGIALNFTHLRYLFLSTSDRTLPKKICRLYHLQVLDVSKCNDLEELPTKFNNLINLRHFIVSESNQNLHSLIAGVGKLVNLQNLCEFRVRKKRDFQIEQLRELKELCGMLCIYNLENVESTSITIGAGLIEKPFLSKLQLSWDRNNSDEEHAVDSDVLECLQPHRYLKELKITGYGGATSAKWLNSLTCLEELRLKDCVAWKILPPIGQLPLLKRLYLYSMSAIREIGADFYGYGPHVPFQYLEVIKIKNLPNLTMWTWNWNGHRKSFPALLELSIKDCPYLDLSLPSGTSQIDCNMLFPKLNELQIIECPKVVQFSPLPFNEKVSVTTENVGSFGRFQLSASSLTIYEPSNRKAWDEVSFHNLRARAITSLNISSNPYPLSWDSFLYLVYLEKLSINDSSVMFSLPNNKSYNQRCPPLMSLNVLHLNRSDITGKQLTWMLHHMPMLSHLKLENCHKIKSIGVATTINEPIFTESLVIELEEDEGLLQIPTSLKFLKMLCFRDCLNMVFANERGLSELASVQNLVIGKCSQLLSSFEHEQRNSNVHLLPSGLQELTLDNMPEGTSVLLQGLFSLIKLTIDCGPDLYPFNFTSCTALEELNLFSYQGFAHLAVPTCGKLTSLQRLTILDKDAINMSEEQEEALLLLTSLKVITLYHCQNLQYLPAKLHQLRSLEKLVIVYCRKIQSPPENGLPKSFRMLEVYECGPEVEKLFAEYECGPQVKKNIDSQQIFCSYLWD